MFAKHFVMFVVVFLSSCSASYKSMIPTCDIGTTESPQQVKNRQKVVSTVREHLFKRDFNMVKQFYSNKMRKELKDDYIDKVLKKMSLKNYKFYLSEIPLYFSNERRLSNNTWSLYYTGGGKYGENWYTAEISCINGTYRITDEISGMQITN